MSTAPRVVPPPRPEVAALNQACAELAEQSYLDRYELAVKSRVEAGIADDNELRKTDELLREIVRGADGLEEGTKSAISEAHAVHKALIAAVKPWKERWEVMRNSLSGLILKYNRDKAALAQRQQAELNRAAEEERQRKAAEARALLRDGNVAGAKIAMQEAGAIITPIISQAKPVLENSSTRQPWQAEITDPEAVVKAIAAGTIPLSVIKEWDLSFLRKEATKRGGLNWPGVRAWQEEKLAVSRR